MNTNRVKTLTLFVCLTLCGNLFSQTKTDTPPIRIRANLMVLDSKGQFSDVKAEEITILEDGVEQKIANLSKKDSFNLGFVIDNSASLRFQLEAIIGTANLIVENLREIDSAFVVRFVSSDKIEMFQDWTSDKNLLKQGITSMFIEGGKSAVFDAVKLAADKLVEKKSESKRSALVLISDCEDRDSFYKLNEALKSIKDNGVEVYVLGFTRDLEGSLLPATSPKQKAIDLAEAFATGSGGLAFFPKWSKKKPDELIAATKAIVLELRSQYVVEYVSTNSNPKDRKRKISIEIADAPNSEKRQAVARSVVELEKN